MSLAAQSPNRPMIALWSRTGGDEVGLGVQDYALAGLIGLIWLMLGWLLPAGFAVPGRIFLPLCGIAMTVCLLGMLILDRHRRRARAAERDALQMCDMLSQALDAVPVGVQIKDADLRYVWISTQHEQRTGYGPAEMLGKTVEEIGLAPALAAAVSLHDRRILASGQTEGPEEQVIVLPDGRLQYITLVTKVPLLRDGKVSHIVTLAADLQHWREAQMRAEEVRRLLETVLDAAPISIHVTDRAGRFRWANRALCEAIGWNAGSLIGKTWQEVLPLINPVQEAVEEERDILAGRRSLVQLQRDFPATGDLPERRLLVTKVPLYDATGTVEQILTMGTDVTALMQARADADTANRLVEGILQNVPLSIQVKDTDLRFRWVNRAFGEAVGRDIGDLLGRTLHDLDIPAESKARGDARDQSVLASGDTIRYDETHLVAGAARHIMFVKAPMLDAAGRATHVITIGADVSEVHRLRAEVDDTHRRLQAVLDAVPVTIALKDTDRRFVWVNREYENVHGRPAKTVFGRRAEDFMPDQVVATAVARADAAVLAGLGPHPTAQRQITVDGRDAAFTMKHLAVRDADGRIDGVLEVGMEVTELLRTTTELQRVNEELEQRVAERAGELAKVNDFIAIIIDRAPVPIVTFHLDGRIRSWNPAATRLTGFSEAEALGACMQTLFPAHRLEIAARLQCIARGESYANLETPRRRRDGTMIELVASGAPLARDNSTIEGGIAIWLDVTQQRAAERQLRQAQKMEAIGQLTGNVAHDFNNLLAVVIGNLDLLMEDLPADAADRELVRDAIDAAERGAALTGRLLAFARQQTLRPITVSIAGLLDGMRSLVKRAVGDGIVVEHVIGADLWLARIDVSQLESAILNLSVNARDAMPTGGRLRIAAHNATLDAAYASLHAEMAAGDYVCISVSDTGSGIAPEILGQVFEPFFTTKGAGKGTGLGLSIVYGFVKQSDGHIHVYSEIGSGTCFRLYLPRVSGTAPAEVSDGSIVLGDGETILLVEDNPQLRRTSSITVKALGYTVLAAADAEAALALLDTHPDIRLLFSDVVLPGGMNGFELAREACRRRPGLGVLFVSGFVDPALVYGQQVVQEAEILTKPFRRTDLAARLRAALRRPQQTVAAVETS